MKNIIKNSLSISGFCLILLTALIGVSQVQTQTVADNRPMALPPIFGLSSVLRLNDSANGATLHSIMMLPTIYQIKVCAAQLP